MPNSLNVTLDPTNPTEESPVRSPEVMPGLEPLYRTITLTELLTKAFKPRENILEPWLPAQGLAMVYAPRGLGKTHVSLGIAYSVSTGGTFLGWKASRPRGVLFIDGEMPGIALQERLTRIVATQEVPTSIATLMFLTPDEQPFGMPDLGTPEGQYAIDQMLTPEIDLIIVDNLSTLVRSGKENEGEGWLPVQDWALRHRALGRSVLFIHHAGKGGQQRGSSRREDVLDTVISLRMPSDYSPDQGARFEVHFEKARGFQGDDAKPFIAHLQSGGDMQRWETLPLEDSTYEQVIELTKQALSPGDIADELGVNKSTVSRHLKRARQEGRLPAASTSGKGGH